MLAACRFNEAEDHLNRGRVVNKALDILVELTVSLDVNAGGTIALQLQDLYTYMQKTLLEAHAEKSHTKLMEVVALLSTLLEGWKQIAAANANDAGYGFAPGVMARPAASEAAFARL